MGYCLWAHRRDAAEHRRAKEELRRRNRALGVISACNRAVIHASDEASLLSDVCRIAVEVGGYRLAWVGYAEHDEAKTIRPVAQAGLGAGYVET